MSLRSLLLLLAFAYSACGVKGDPISPDEEAIISDGTQKTTRNNVNTNSKQKKSSEEESDENKKKQSR